MQKYKKKWEIAAPTKENVPKNALISKISRTFAEKIEQT